jgi:hypothetical protein
MQRGCAVFRIRWLNDNRVIGLLFAALIIVNALAIENGYYG